MTERGDGEPAVSRTGGVALETWPGTAPGIVAVHATGFCGAVWRPVVAELRRLGVENSLTAVDQRGHGESADFTGGADWWQVAEDVAEVAPPGSVGVGHSSGGAAVLAAEQRRPGTFAAIVAIEPVVFPPGLGDDVGRRLAAGARRRRDQFADRTEALGYFADKAVFAQWDPRALDAYVDGCLRSGDGGLTLKCRPEAEAVAYEASSRMGLWPLLGDIGAPVLLLAGEQSETHPPDVMRAMAAELPDVELRLVPGHGHFLPMEAPGAVAAAIAGWPS